MIFNDLERRVCIDRAYKFEGLKCELRLLHMSKTAQLYNFSYYS